MRDRVEYYFRDVRGFAYDEVRACMAAGWTDLLDLEARLKRVQGSPRDARFRTHRRQLQTHQEHSEASRSSVAIPLSTKKLLEPGPERDLYDAMRRVSGQPLESRIGPLRPKVDLFFDKVLVNAPDPNIRRNRLALLQNLLTEFSDNRRFLGNRHRKAIMKKYVYAFRRRHRRRRWQDERRARRQRRRPGRDEPRGRARAARLHHLHRSLQHLFPEQEQRSERDRRGDRARARESRKEDGQEARRPSDPLLVSVRSGAKFSMPGMMNTILNLGLNDKTVEGLAKKSGNPRFAYDCYRRFIQMFGEVALDIDMHKFDHIFDERKRK
jgi:hypothetical protein